MAQEEFNFLLRFFKALGNESRLKILGYLSNQERSVEELAILLELKEPTVSHHLSRLKELGLVRMRADGNTHFYRLDGGALRSMNREVFTPEKMASLVDDVGAANWEERVLGNFVEGRHLKQIPASRKKRGVILKWLADKFEEGVAYPEREVNERLKQYHPDCATLRREFIAEGLMDREKGVYRRA